MIKNYKQFNESLKDKLVGPTEDEVMDNFKDLSPNELLLKSCKNGFLKGVEIALEKGANIHLNNDEPLVFASRNQHIDVVKLLFDKGTDFNIEMSLISTTFNGNKDLSEIILDNGDYTNSLIDESLVWASANGKIEIVKLLLDIGADIHTQEDDSLNRACRSGHIDVVKLLLDRGADIYNKNNFPLRNAKLSDNDELIEYIKKCMEKPNLYNRIISKFKKTNESLRDKLVGPTEDEVLNNFKDFSPDGLLYKSCVSGFLKGVEIALSKGADISHHNYHALITAKEEGNQNIIDYLYESPKDFIIQEFDNLKRTENNKNGDITYQKGGYTIIFQEGGYTCIRRTIWDVLSNVFDLDEKESTKLLFECLDECGIELFNRDFLSKC